MKYSQGGTEMYCPHCKKIRICKAVDPSVISTKRDRKWQSKDYSDIHWFRRGRVCQTCSYKFLTAEIQESFLSELIELRSSLSEVKNNVEIYMKDLDAASKNLDKLSNSLNELKLLQAYQKV